MLATRAIPAAGQVPVSAFSSSREGRRGRPGRRQVRCCRPHRQIWWLVFRRHERHVRVCCGSGCRWCWRRRWRRRLPRLLWRVGGHGHLEVRVVGAANVGNVWLHAPKSKNLGRSDEQKLHESHLLPIVAMARSQLLHVHPGSASHLQVPAGEAPAGVPEEQERRVDADDALQV